MNYDIIGDVHGHAAALKALLAGLGYRLRAGVWRRGDRLAYLTADGVSPQAG